MSEQIQLEISQPGADEIVVSLRGELHLGTAPQADATFAALPADQPVVVLDLSQLEFIDSTGLNTILALYQRLDAAGRSLVVRNPTDSVRTVLRVCGLEAHFGLETAG